MAGSIKWFVYTTDNGEDYGIQLDESNTEAVNGGTQDYVAGLTIIYALPRNVKPRTVFYGSADGNRVIKVVALTQAIYTGVLASASTITDPLTPANTLGIIRLRPEIITRLPFAGDTGQIDGDAT